MIVQEISKNIDGYRLSTYMHKQAEGDDGGKLFMGPIWDVNLGFDNADSHGNGLGHDPTGWLFAGSPPRGRHGGCSAGCYWYPFWWAMLFADPDFAPRLACHWHALRQAQFSDAALAARVADHAAVLTESAARNFERLDILGRYVWPNPNPDRRTWAAEVEGMLEWIVTRAAWMDDNMPALLASCDDGFAG
jgi:hypothetical protein